MPFNRGRYAGRAYFRDYGDCTALKNGDSATQIRKARVWLDVRIDHRSYQEQLQPIGAGVAFRAEVPLRGGRAGGCWAGSCSMAIV